MQINVTLLPGDGIGPEVTNEAMRTLRTVCKVFGHEFKSTTQDIGGAALISSGDPFPEQSLQACRSSKAVLLGAVGGPAFDKYPSHLRPERGLLRLRQELGVFANLRPAICFAALEDSSPLRPEIIRGTDMLIVRELLGGLYFGEPRWIQGENGQRSATDTMHYGEQEIERVAHIAFDLARSRRHKVTSVDKANVLDCSRLWRDVVNRVAQQYSDVDLSHMYVDSAAMALVSRPADFDVLLTENMFGDILSDQAGAVVGSIGMLGSASIGGPIALYEPVHGSAPDIAGRGIANPLGAILSAAMMLRYSFQLEAEARAVESAAESVLHRGLRTKDLAKQSEKCIRTDEMGSAVAETIEKRVEASTEP
ncbi:MAG: 3-isopropylmalate dehydrogenase [Terriglobales bacterium]